MALDLEAMFDEPEPTKGPECSMRTLLDSLTEDERAIVEAQLARPMTEKGHKSIYRVLDKAFGDTRHVPSPYTVGRHRNGECKCYR